MDGKATGQLTGGDGDGDGAASSSQRAEAHLTSGSEDEDCDDLYGDVNVGFLPLMPLSLSPAPTSPPQTPSPGRDLSSSPSPGPALRLSPSPEPQSHPKTPSASLTPSPSLPPHRALVPKPSAKQSQTPRPPTPEARKHQTPHPQPAPRGDSSSSSSPPGSALYISELPWWTTDAEVEAALVPDVAPALRGLFFYSNKFNGMSRGVCRADFFSPDAAALAAVALHGHDFHGRNCVASLTRPAALNRLGDDSDAEPVQNAPNPLRGLGSLGTGRGTSNTTPVRGNVGPVLSDRSVQGPVPQLPMALRPHGLPFCGTMGRGGGYGGWSAGMSTGMMTPAVAHHVNPAFMATVGMAMRGPGVWPDQAMDGGFWGAQPPWNFRGCQFPWQHPASTMQVQQQHGEGDYGKGRGMRRGRPGRSDEKGIGNVLSYPGRRQSDHDGGDLYKEHDREERSRHLKRVPEKERETERNWGEEDRRRGDKRRYQECSEDDDDDRRARARARSQSRNDGYDDHPRRRR